MRARIFFLAGSLVIAFATRAAFVDVTSVVTQSGTNAVATGGAQYHYDLDHTGNVPISGYFSLFENLYDVNDTPFVGWNGNWTGTITYAGDYGNCYQAGVSAHAIDTETNTKYSATTCITGQYNPPPYHGYDICPLILDLDGDGVPTTGLENAVAFFDTNRDGIRESSGWTSPYARDAFLWMDLNQNGSPDPGELFGAGMPLPGGGYARNGFHALSAYDEASSGGNGDGYITRDDAVWDSLRLWIDLNHDGRSSPHEIMTPGAEHITGFDLDEMPIHHADSHGNVIMYFGWFDLKLHDAGSAPYAVHRRLVDLSFIPSATP